MHIPDGFIDAPVAAASGVVAVAAVAVSLRGARREVSEASAPLAGLTAVFVFAAQMVNFPVGAGTSGHLIGAALAAILIGPYAAVLAMTVVITIQALVFADGGLTALRLNMVNMAVVATVCGWLVFPLGARGGFRSARRRKGIGPGVVGRCRDFRIGKPAGENAPDGFDRVRARGFIHGDADGVCVEPQVDPLGLRPRAQRREFRFARRHRHCIEKRRIDRKSVV